MASFIGIAIVTLLAVFGTSLAVYAPWEDEQDVVETAMEVRLLQSEVSIKSPHGHVAVQVDPKAKFGEEFGEEPLSEVEAPPQELSESITSGGGSSRVMVDPAILRARHDEAQARLQEQMRHRQAGELQRLEAQELANRRAKLEKEKAEERLEAKNPSTHEYMPSAAAMRAKARQDEIEEEEHMRAQAKERRISEQQRKTNRRQFSHVALTETAVLPEQLAETVSSHSEVGAEFGAGAEAGAEAEVMIPALKRSREEAASERQKEQQETRIAAEKNRNEIRAEAQRLETEAVQKKKTVDKDLRAKGYEKTHKFNPSSIRSSKMHELLDHEQKQREAASDRRQERLAAKYAVKPKKQTWKKPMPSVDQKISNLRNTMKAEENHALYTESRGELQRGVLEHLDTVDAEVNENAAQDKDLPDLSASLVSSSRVEVNPAVLRARHEEAKARLEEQKRRRQVGELQRLEQQEIAARRVELSKQKAERERGTEETEPTSALLPSAATLRAEARKQMVEEEQHMREQAAERRLQQQKKKPATVLVETGVPPSDIDDIAAPPEELAESISSGAGSSRVEADPAVLRARHDQAQARLQEQMRHRQAGELQRLEAQELANRRAKLEKKKAEERLEAKNPSTHEYMSSAASMRAKARQDEIEEEEHMRAQAKERRMSEQQRQTNRRQFSHTV